MSSTYRSMSFAANVTSRAAHCRWVARKQDRVLPPERLGECARDDVFGRLIQVRRERVVALLWPVPVEILVGPTAEEHRSRGGHALTHPLSHDLVVVRHCTSATVEATRMSSSGLPGA
jgi:hypothetical protein